MKGMKQFLAAGPLIMDSLVTMALWRGMRNHYVGV